MCAVQSPFDSSLWFIYILFIICDTDGAVRSDCGCPGSWTQDQEVPDLPLGPRHCWRQTTNADVWNWSQHVSRERAHEHNIAELYFTFYINVINIIIYWHVPVNIAVVQWFWMPSLRSRMRLTPHSHSDAPAVRVRNKEPLDSTFSVKPKWTSVPDFSDPLIVYFFRYLRLMCHEHKWRQHTGMPE